MKIIVNNQESNIRCVSAAEYPKVPSFDEGGDSSTQTLKLSSELIVEGIQAVSFAAAVAVLKSE